MVYVYNNVDVYQFKPIHNITWQKVYEIVPLSSTQDMKEGWKDRFHPVWSLEGRRDIPSTKCKGVGHVCQDELVSSCSLSLFGL